MKEFIKGNEEETLTEETTKIQDKLKEINKNIKATKLKNDKTGKVIGDYVEVNQRVKGFRELYPKGLIKSEILQMNNGVCVIKTEVFDEEGTLLSVGHAYEKEDSSFINKTSYLENCETSAVGRALGFLGIGIDSSIASKEEVINAVTNQEQKEIAKATTSQLKFIQNLFEDDVEELKDILKKLGKKNTGELNVEEASKIISDKKSNEETEE